MSDDKTADEQPKRKIAKRVVTEKRKYFIPSHSRGDVEASSPQEAVEKSEKLNESNQTEEDGDV